MRYACLDSHARHALPRIVLLHMTQVYIAIESKKDKHILWHMTWSLRCLAFVGEVSAQPDMIDLTDAGAAQQHQQAAGHTGSKLDAALAVQPSASDRERGHGHAATAVTPSKAAMSREQTSTAGSPISPAISSGRKQKQADIRGFLSPKF